MTNFFKVSNFGKVDTDIYAGNLQKVYFKF